jgi:hypothetical protein
MALGDYAKTTYVNGGTPAINGTNLNKNETKTAELDLAAKKMDGVRRKIRMKGMV